jgi:hypothetical protein
LLGVRATIVATRLLAGELLISGALACFVPTQRAARIHPAVTLRND